MEQYQVYLLLAVVSTILHTTFTYAYDTLTVKPRARTCDGTYEYVYNKCECLQFVINPQVFWKTAVDKCETKGGQLVTIKDKKKQKFIADILDKISNGKEGVWIGLKRVSDNVYKWVDGEVLDEENSSWEEGEPNPILLNQDCVHMHMGNKIPWSWKDYICNTIPYSHICEYELPCGSEEDKDQFSLSTNEIIGVVVGGVLGLICSFAVIFLIINCCRDLVRRKRGGRRVIELREMETGSGYEEPQSSQPMIPPPEKTRRPKARENDLDRSSIKRKKAPLLSANVVLVNPPAARKPKRQESVKISNAPAAEQSENATNDAVEKDRASFGSIEDNYLNANTDTGATKEYNSSVCDINKL